MHFGVKFSSSNRTLIIMTAIGIAIEACRYLIILINLTSEFCTSSQYRDLGVELCLVCCSAQLETRGLRDCGPRPGSCRPSPSGRWASLSGPARLGSRAVAAGLVSPPTLPAKASSKEVARQRCLNSKTKKKRSHHQDFRL